MASMRDFRRREGDKKEELNFVRDSKPLIAQCECFITWFTLAKEAIEISADDTKSMDDVAKKDRTYLEAFEELRKKFKDPQKTIKELHKVVQRATFYGMDPS